MVAFHRRTSEDVWDLHVRADRSSEAPLRVISVMPFCLPYAAGHRVTSSHEFVSTKADVEFALDSGPHGSLWVNWKCI